MRKMYGPPRQDPETGEWKYRGKYWEDDVWEQYNDDLDAYDEACDREYHYRKENPPEDS